jgi:hypothetical protein
MAAVTAEVEAKKKPRPASPEYRTREEARSGTGNGASAGMPFFLQRSALQLQRTSYLALAASRRMLRK